MSSTPSPYPSNQVAAERHQRLISSRIPINAENESYVLLIIRPPHFQLCFIGVQ